MRQIPFCLECAASLREEGSKSMKEWIGEWISVCLCVCVCDWEGERERERARGQNDKNKPALVRIQAGHLMAKSIKPWWKITSVDVAAALLITESLQLKYSKRTDFSSTKKLRSTYVITKGWAETNINEYCCKYTLFDHFPFSNLCGVECTLSYNNKTAHNYMNISAPSKGRFNVLWMTNIYNKHNFPNQHSTMYIQLYNTIKWHHCYFLISQLFFECIICQIAYLIFSPNLGKKSL